MFISTFVTCNTTCQCRHSVRSRSQQDTVDTVDFAPVSPPGEIDETRVISDSAHSHHRMHCRRTDASGDNRATATYNTCRKFGRI